MYELLLTEKPSASIQIANALADKKPIKKNFRGVPYYELEHKGKKIIVGCAVGHLYNLTEKEKTQTYPNFNLEWQPSYKVSKNAQFTKKYLDTLKKLTKEADKFTVACDYDTEGSLIGWNCIKFICKQKNANRMKFSTLTKDELINSYEKKSKTLDFPLIETGETRHYADFFWGISSSRALTNSIKKAGSFKILSSGRVQSPTLTLLTHREEEIKKFKPKTFWQLIAHIKIKNQIIQALHKTNKFWEQRELKKIFEKCKGKKALVKKIIKKQFKVLPPAPFNITSLQTEAYKLFKFSPKQTLDIAQTLYLSAYISYPRTSSEKLPKSIGYEKILNLLSKKFKEIKLVKKPLKPNEGKQVDPAHVAIYPTTNLPKKLTPEQNKIYTLIVKRFISTFGQPALKENLEINFEIEKEIFKTKGSTILKQGWFEIYKPYISLKEITLPKLKEKEIHDVKKLEIKEDQTKPPKRYTQGSIIAEMDKRGIGTRATRSQILQILYDRDYIEDKSIKVTQLGKAVAETLEKFVPDLVSEKLTRHFEKEMEQIREKRKTKEEVLEEAQKVLIKICKEFKKNEEKIGKNLITALKETQNTSQIVGKCPNCKGQLRIMYSKKNRSYFIACNKYPKCKTTFSLPNYALPKPLNKTCEECGFPLVQMIRKGRKPYEYCINKNCKLKEKWLKENQKI